ncbi:flagellar protein FliT [Paenibacillus sp. MSJ-34]|uniref:flagellar protein FliT n=1 Tax=Paenibacillus sp. MSJ-34 TaxID=2841529 RepID=UPI001C10D2AE|nr:flagellar protein FliT [Paenibacillus sp. MSJ-34]MBU5440989.1 hypothetical protein [Paenibacillus sp. MSJ-34]
MEKPSANLYESRHQCFVEMLNIIQQQMQIFVAGNIDEQIEQYNHLSDRFTSIQEHIDHLNSMLSTQDLAVMNVDDRVEETKSIIKEIIDRQKLLRGILERHYDELRTSMKSVKEQQTVRNAYYGMDSADQIALYFDEKK